MGFLISANSRTRAGWFEDFVRPGLENPVRKPWVHLGDGSPADINNIAELHIPQNNATTNGGGESYAYQPKTNSWGFECSFWWPVGGAAAQSYDFYFTDSWVKKGATFSNAVGIRFFYRSAIGGGPNIYIGQFPSMWQVGSLIATFTPPIPFNGQNLILKVWVEDDRWVRVWLNDTYLGSATVDNSYRFGEMRRCLRMVNGTFSDAWMQWLYHYDRPATLPPNSIFNSIFYDNFDGRSGNQNGVNGWSQFGSNAGVSSNSWAMTGTTDGSNMLLRNTGITNGRMRIVATTGGAAAPNNSRDQSLILCSNSGGTAGLSANFFGNKIYLSRWTGSPTSPSYTDFTSRLGEVSVPNNTQVAFEVFDGVAFMEINGDRVLYATVGSTVPPSNSWAGLRVSRASFTNSGSWNDVRIYGT